MVKLIDKEEVNSNTSTNSSIPSESFEIQSLSI